MSTYGANATKNMAQILANPRDGLFAPSCFLHCGFKLDKPLINGVGVIDALHQWVLTKMPSANSTGVDVGNHDPATSFKWMDSGCGADGKQFWPPCNPTCPPLPAVTGSRRREEEEGGAHGTAFDGLWQ